MCSQGQDASSKPAAVWSPEDRSDFLLVQPAGLLVPVPGIPSWFQGVCRRAEGSGERPLAGRCV